MNQLPPGVVATPTPTPGTSGSAVSPVPHSTGPSTSSPKATDTSATAAKLIWSTVGDQSTANGVKILVYGSAGMGKTVLCATLPMPTVFISSENGLLSLSLQNLTKIFMGLGMDQASAQQRAQAVKECPVIIVKSGLQLRAAHAWVSDPANAHLFKSVAWDSASETAEAMLNASKAVKADMRQAYGEVADIIAEFFRKFRDIPGKNVCITAKMGSIQDAVSGKVKNGPDFPVSNSARRRLIGWTNASRFKRVPIPPIIRCSGSCKPNRMKAMMLRIVAVFWKFGSAPTCRI
jgi:hypothetical protein